MTKKFQNLIGFPVRLYDATLDIVGRGLRVLGVPLGFTIGGVHTSLSVTANALSNLCAVPAVPPATTAPMNIYLATAPDGGNDTTGDGTITKPFLTITKALSIVPRILRHKVTILPKKGQYAGLPKSNNFVCEGGQLIVDASGEPLIIFLANQVVDSIVSLGNPETVGKDQAWKITGLAANWAPGDSYGFLWVHFKTGACAGRFFPIWKNTVTELIIGMGAESVAPADIFDLVFVSVAFYMTEEVNFNFNHAREYNYYSGAETIDFGVAGVSLVWTATPTSNKLLTIQNANCSFAFTDIRKVQNTVTTMLTLVSSNMNSQPIAAGTFTDPIHDNPENNWLNSPAWGGNDQPVGAQAIWITDSAISQISFPGTVWLSGVRANWIQTGLLWFVRSSTASDPLLSNLFFDSRVESGSAVLLRSSNVQISNCFIYDEESALNLSDGSTLNCTFFKMKPAGVTGPTACKFENGVSGKIQAAGFDLAGISLTAAAVKFSLGDASGYNSLPAAGFDLTDTTDCWIHSV
jgi:hypothetical protein